MFEWLIIILFVVVIGFIEYSRNKKDKDFYCKTYNYFVSHISNYNPNVITKDFLSAHGITGNNINNLLKDGDTLLIKALLEADNPTISEKIIECGAQVDKKNIKGQTPLYIACLLGNEEKIKLLMKHGADLHACMNDGDNLLIQISRVCLNPETVISMIINYGIDVNEKGTLGMTALATVCATPDKENRQLEKVKTLLQYGADVNAETDDGVSVLNIAVKNPFINLDVVKILLDSGADILSRDKNGNSVTDCLAHNPNKVIQQKIKQLLAKRS